MRKVRYPGSTYTQLGTQSWPRNISGQLASVDGYSTCHFRELARCVAIDNVDQPYKVAHTQ